MLNENYYLNNDFIIKLCGRFDANTVKGMKDDLETYSKFSSTIIFDLEQVSFIDSSGIGAIVFLYKRMVAKGYCVYVIGLSQQPLELFQMLFLDKTIDCYQNIAAYLQSPATMQVAS